jgi:hypothetical protein
MPKHMKAMVGTHVQKLLEQKVLRCFGALH